MDTFYLSKKYINSEPIIVSNNDLKTLIELEQYQIQFSDEEIFTFKIGNIPSGSYALVHEKTNNPDGVMEMPYISFYTEAARNTLEKITNIVKTVNINLPTHGLRFNKIHRFFKRDLSKDDALEKINQIIKFKTNEMFNYKKNTVIRNKTFHDKCNQLYLALEDLRNARKEIEDCPENSSFLESNYFRFNMVDYVYLKFPGNSGNFTSKRFNLCTKLPNAIILNDEFKKSLNRRSDKKLDQMLKEHSTILSQEVFPYDIFFKRKN